MERTADLIDKVLRRIGNGFAWTIVLLMLAIVVQVVLRYGFDITSIKLEEMQWHLYAMGMMLGLSYALGTDDHIRVDVIQSRLSARTRAVIDILGTLFLLLPFATFLFIESLPFVQHAFQIQERSNAPSGLPWRWLIKGFIPAGCLLLILSGLSHLLRSIVALRTK